MVVGLGGRSGLLARNPALEGDGYALVRAAIRSPCMVVKHARESIENSKIVTLNTAQVRPLFNKKQMIASLVCWSLIQQFI